MTRKEVLEFILPIDGWLSSHEGYFLHETARKTKGNIVEIGSWKGKSTICLATGIGKKGKVYAIDPHKGKYSGGKKSPTFKVFQSNLKKAGVASNVVSMIATSQEAERKWEKLISFLFIDGLHDYKHTMQDFSLWSPFLKKNGTIAFHDAFCGHEGPGKVVLQEILKNEKWSKIGIVGSIIYATKQQPRSMIEKIDKIRQQLLIPFALTLHKSNIPGMMKFLLIHRVIKLLLINPYTLSMQFKK